VQLQALEGNGTVVISVNDRAEVSIDGQSYGEVQSFKTLPLKAGTHRITAKFRNNRNDDKVVVVEKDKEVRVALERPL
jgi:hypothetical protein